MSDDHYKMLTWRWFLERAGIPDYYGGYDHHLTDATKAHLKDCGIDYSLTNDIYLDTTAEFTDTENDSAQILSILGAISCKCGKVNNAEFAIKNPKIGMGQVIQEVMQLDATIEEDPI